MEIIYPPIFGMSLGPGANVIQYATYFFNLGMFVAASLAIVSIAIGGVFYLVSFSSGKFTNNGKEWVRSGTTGLVILMCAYLIAYTINPALVAFKLGNLLPAQFGTGQNGETVPFGSTVIYYNEYPLGTLTETLLTKTISCYNFDSEGNPIPVDEGPTYKNHDRTDCLLKLMDGAQKKAQIMGELSYNIKELMAQCTCAGKCNDPCNSGGNGCQVAGAGCGGACAGGAACSQPDGTNSCCPQDVKDKIEHGKIAVTTGQCSPPEKEYDGLDEFRCKDKCSNIPGIVEKKVKINKEDVVIIDTDKWNQLNLVQQLTYFKEKIEEAKSQIKADLNKLDSARSAVADCYDIKSSSDFLKIKESVKKEDKKIVLSHQFQSVDSSKYCKGFNYANSSCYKQCSDACPETTRQVVDCYSTCLADECDPDDDECFKQKETCIKDCYNDRACKNGDGRSNTFKECVSVCQQDCTSMCSKTNLECSGDHDLCKNLCENNSSCILDNAGTCLFNMRIMDTEDFTKCVNQEDFSNVKNCIDSGYLCKYGSNENAGYKECTNGYSGCAPDSEELENEKYSSPYIFENKDKQRCPNAYQVCQSGANKGITCVDIYTETKKCPSASNCPDCPCGKINVDIDLNVNTPGPSDDFVIPDPDNPAYNGIIETITAYDIVTGECNEYGYNRDPLTFYCKTEFVQTQPITGEGFECSLAQEVPVGQAIDDSKKWADDLIKTIDSYNELIKGILGTAKNIEDKQENEYCRCDSKFDTGKPICKTDCIYTPPAFEGNDDAGNPVFSKAQCDLAACSGNSCEQMMFYLDVMMTANTNVRKEFIKNTIDGLKDTRTDPLKELTYSRKTMASCSGQMIRREKNSIKTISCTIAFPSTGFLNESCHGKLEGQVKEPPADQTDNWFCCQKINK